MDNNSPSSSKHDPFTVGRKTGNPPVSIIQINEASTSNDKTCNEQHTCDVLSPKSKNDKPLIDAITCAQLKTQPILIGRERSHTKSQKGRDKYFAHKWAIRAFTTSCIILGGSHCVLPSLGDAFCC